MYGDKGEEEKPLEEVGEVKRNRERGGKEGEGERGTDGEGVCGEEELLRAY